MPSPIEEALHILTKAKEDIQQVLQGHELETNSVFITSGLTNQINKLSFQLGLQTGSETAAPQTFAPVTEFFGEKIERQPDVLPEQLINPPSEQEIYQQKVAALQESFRTMQPESIISSYSQPSDELVLRGVAKRAGLEDYEQGTINIDFVERIKSGLNANDAAIVEQAAINAELEGNNPPSFESDVQDVPATEDVPAKTATKKAKK